jgi:hypothetical protein
VNFARYRSFVLGLTKGHRAGGLLRAVLFCSWTAQSRQGEIAPFAELSGCEGVSPVRLSVRLAGALETTAIERHWRALGEDGLAKSYSSAEAFPGEKHGYPGYGSKKRILAGLRSAAWPCAADLLRLCTRAMRCATAGHLQRICRRARPTVVETLVSEHA